MWQDVSLGKRIRFGSAVNQWRLFNSLSVANKFPFTFILTVQKNVSAWQHTTICLVFCHLVKQKEQAITLQSSLFFSPERHTELQSYLSPAPRSSGDISRASGTFSALDNKLTSDNRFFSKMILWGCKMQERERTCLYSEESWHKLRFKSNSGFYVPHGARAACVYPQWNQGWSISSGLI